MLTRSDAPNLRPLIVAGMVGNAMEWYDFSIYGTLAPLLARLFFPTTDPSVALLATFAIFAVGFFARPFGGVVFGQVGDRLGRKPAIVGSILLMSLATALIGLLPTHRDVGLAAAGFLILARILQGVSAGGELVGSAAYLVEQAPVSHRAFVTSFVYAGASSGSLLGALIAAVLTAALPTAELDAWGWRVPFLLGLAVGAVGLWARLRLDETPAFVALRAAGPVVRTPALQALRQFPGVMIGVLAIHGFAALAFYLLVAYLPSFLQSVAGLPLAQTLPIFTLNYLVQVILVPPMAALSDRVGRKSMLLVWGIGLVLLSYPLFMLLSHGGIGYAALGVLSFGAWNTIGSGSMLTLTAEAFPTRIRYSALAISYNLGVSLFGGTAPLLGTYLVGTTHNPLAPAFMLMVAGVVALGMLVRLPDRHGQPLA